MNLPSRLLKCEVSRKLWIWPLDLPLVPLHRGEWLQPQLPSSIENEGIVLTFGDNRATKGLWHRGL